MKIRNQIFICSFIVLITNPSFAVKIKCDDFTKEAKKFQKSALKNQKDLNNIEKQLKANTKAVDDYNKNCRAASNPKCNPAMYNIISGQISVLSGQREKLTNDIKINQTKEQDAIESYKSCKDTLDKKSI